MSRLFNPTDETNGQIIDHVHVRVESNEKSKIPKMKQKQSINHFNDDRKRSLASEYTNHMTVPSGAENNLGVVHQKRVEEEVEETSAKRNKILKLVKRQMYEPPYWEPRATIRGNKAMKNPILQLLRAAAGQKTQRILGLNSKAFDIFPGPMPEERNIALNNDLGKVTSEAPTGNYPGVNQQIVQGFRRPSFVRRQQFLQPEQQFYQQQPLQQQFARPANVEQPDMISFQQPLQQRPMEVPQQQMAAMENFPHSRGFSTFGSFSRRQPSVMAQPQPQRYLEAAASLQGEELVSRQLPSQQMYLGQNSASTEMYHAQQIQEESPEVRSLPRTQYEAKQYLPDGGLPQYQEMPSPPEAVGPAIQQSQAPIEMPSYQETGSHLSEIPHYPVPEYQPTQQMYEQQPDLSAMAFQRTLPRKPQQKMPTVSDLSNEQIGKLLDTSSLTSSVESEIRHNAPNPLAETRQIVSNEIPQLSRLFSNNLYQVPVENQQAMSRNYLPGVSLTAPHYPVRPLVGAPHHFIPSHIPRHRYDDDDFDDEKPEVHVHIQTEKSHISKPNEMETPRAAKAKKS